MEHNDIDAAILSVPVPVSVLGKQGVEAAALCREVNEYMADLRAADEKRFGYLAALPSLEDTQACVDELRIALDERGADGVTLFTSYDTGIPREREVQATSEQKCGGQSLNNMIFERQATYNGSLHEPLSNPDLIAPTERSKTRIIGIHRVKTQTPSLSSS